MAERPSKIDAIEKKLNQLKAQRADLLARESSKKRKAETRSKIIIGGVYLTIARRGPDEAKKLLSFLEKADLREQDKQAIADVMSELRTLSMEKKEQKPEAARPDLNMEAPK